MDHSPKLSTLCSAEIKQCKKNVWIISKGVWNKLKASLYYSINPNLQCCIPFWSSQLKCTKLDYKSLRESKSDGQSSRIHECCDFCVVLPPIKTSFMSSNDILHLKHEWYPSCSLSPHFSILVSVWRLWSLGTLQFEKGMTKGSYGKDLQNQGWRGTDDE